MAWMREELRRKTWGLAIARTLAAKALSDKTAIRALVRELFGDDREARMRAADVARRITDLDAAPLRHVAEELAGWLEAIPLEESRTRWHFALVVARVAHTAEQRIRAARTMMMLAEEQGNAIRCSAIEGLGTLAVTETSLRDAAEELVERSLREGTPAMKSRARHVRKMLARAEAVQSIG